MSLVTVYDKATGQKLPHPVPEHWIGHPTLGPTLAKTPSVVRAEEARDQREDNPPHPGGEEEIQNPPTMGELTPEGEGNHVF